MKISLPQLLQHRGDFLSTITLEKLTMFYYSDCNGIRSHNHLARKRTLNHLESIKRHIRPTKYLREKI